MMKHAFRQWSIRTAGLCLALFLPVRLSGADDPGLNLLRGNFESAQSTYNPWGGVDSSNHLHVWPGKQLAVNNSGQVEYTYFSPSVALGDLNGDGLPDLVVADARGFFWFYPNTGKPDAPAFSYGQIMPIWLSNDWPSGDVVPRIQLIDYNADGKLDLVAGNYAGELFFIPNLGAPSSPYFKMPRDQTSLQVPTHSRNLLWCNYMAPFLYDWTGSHRLDLTMGDGSYSANSIYLLTNKGSNDDPRFSERDMSKIIPGMGREHLTPQVLDWNNDGKPDIISGERTGYIDVYLNQAATKDAAPVFDMDHPEHVVFGTKELAGALTTVCAADLNHDGLFDLLVCDVEGRICVALNKGTLDKPEFGELVPLTGTNPFPKILTPEAWQINRSFPFGAPFGILEHTNAEVEKGFQPPPEFKGKGALKVSLVQPLPDRAFKEVYVPKELKRVIDYVGDPNNFIITTDTDYTFSFWVKTTGTVSSLQWEIMGYQVDTATSENILQTLDGAVSNGSSWTHYTQTFRMRSKVTDQRHIDVRMNLKLTWYGEGTLYFDDFVLTKRP